MRQFKGYIKTDRATSACEFDFEMPEDATAEEIEAEARESAFNHIEWSFDEVDSNE
jgi:hypothetical protein